MDNNCVLLQKKKKNEHNFFLVNFEYLFFMTIFDIVDSVDSGFFINEFSYCLTCIPFYLKDLETSTTLKTELFFCSHIYKAHQNFPIRNIKLTMRSTDNVGSYKMTNDSRRDLIRWMKLDLNRTK